MEFLKELEAQKSVLEFQTNLRDAIINLKKNKDFQTLVQAYCCDEALRLVNLSADLKLKGRDREANGALDLAQACGHFSVFLTTKENEGYQALVELERIKYLITHPEEAQAMEEGEDNE